MTLKGPVSKKRFDELSWFFAWVKSYFNSYWVGMVKYGCVLLGHGTSKIWCISTITELTFLMLIQIQERLKSLWLLLGGHGQTWVWFFRSWDSKTCCISRINEWTELILCMLISIFGYLTNLTLYLWLSKLGIHCSCTCSKSINAIYIWNYLQNEYQGNSIFSEPSNWKIGLLTIF